MAVFYYFLNKFISLTDFRRIQICIRLLYNSGKIFFLLPICPRQKNTAARTKHTKKHLGAIQGGSALSI